MELSLEMLAPTCLPLVYLSPANQVSIKVTCKQSVSLWGKIHAPFINVFESNV